MYGEMPHEFVGPQCLSMIEHIDAVRDQRCGPMGAGLDPDALQSSTQGAVALVSGSLNKRLELTARVFCEMAIKPLFKGILKLMVKHQDKARMLKIRNQWIPMDPSTFKADLDMTVNVGVGAGTINERVAALQQIAAAQKEIIATAGPDNPLCGAREIRNTLSKIVELSGYRDSTQFFKEIPPGAESAPKPPPKPSPEEVLAQAQAQAVQADVEMKREKHQLELLQMKAEDDRERDKQETETLLKIADFQVKNPTYNVAELVAAIKAATTAPRQQVM